MIDPICKIHYFCILGIFSPFLISLPLLFRNKFYFPLFHITKQTS